MKNLLIITLLSISVITFANNSKSTSKVENNNYETTNTNSTLSFNLIDNNEYKTKTDDRIDIIRRVSIESTNKKEIMSLSNEALK